MLVYLCSYACLLLHTQSYTQSPHLLPQCPLEVTVTLALEESGKNTNIERALSILSILAGVFPYILRFFWINCCIGIAELEKSIKGGVKKYDSGAVSDEEGAAITDYFDRARDHYLSSSGRSSAPATTRKEEDEALNASDYRPELFRIHRIVEIDKEMALGALQKSHLP